MPAAVGLRRSTAFMRSYAAVHLMDALAQVIGDLLDERVVEDAALLRGEDLLAVGDLGGERVEHLGERLLAAALRHVHEQQFVLAAARVCAHVGLRQLSVEQLHVALHLDGELARAAAHRQQLARQRARHLERARERPLTAAADVRGRGIAKDELQDRGLRELAKADARQLAPQARRLVLRRACLRVALQPGDARSAPACVGVARVPLRLTCGLQPRCDSRVAATQLLAGRAQSPLARSVLGGQSPELRLFVSSAPVVYRGGVLGLGETRRRGLGGPRFTVGQVPRARDRGRGARRARAVASRRRCTSAVVERRQAARVRPRARDGPRPLRAPCSAAASAAEAACVVRARGLAPRARR